MHYLINTLYSVLIMLLCFIYRRRIGALVDAVAATEVVQDICIGKVPAMCDVGKLHYLS